MPIARRSARVLGRLIAVLVAGYAGVAAAQGTAPIRRLTVNGSAGPVTVSPRLVAGTPILVHPGAPLVYREERPVTVRWSVPMPTGTAPAIPGISLHVTERPPGGPCLRFVELGDLPPSRNLPTAARTGEIALDLGAPVFRPGRTYYVRGCVYGLPAYVGGDSVGQATNTVAVRIDWPDTPSSARVNLTVNSAFSRIEPLLGPLGMAYFVRATLQVTASPSLPDAVRDALPDRFVVDVYADGGRVPLVRRTLTGVARRLAEGGLVEVSLEHPVPGTQEAHLLQYVINADGAIPEPNYEDNAASKSFGYFLHSTGVTFAPNWTDEGPFRLIRVWSPAEEQGDSHAWVYVEYAGGPLKEGPLCPDPPVGAACAFPSTARAVDPTPFLDIWVDRPGVRCVGPGGLVEPTRAIEVGDHRGPARLVDGVNRRRPIKRFFCHFATSPAVALDTTEVFAEGRVHGVTARIRAPLRKTWQPTVADLSTLHLPELTGEVVSVEFLDGMPISSTGVWACGQHPRAVFRVRNTGRAPSPPVIGHAWIAPPTMTDPRHYPCLTPGQTTWFARDLPPLDPGDSFEFTLDFTAETTVPPRATVHIDVDARFEAVEQTKTDNRQLSGVPTCPGDPRCREP